MSAGDEATSFFDRTIMVLDPTLDDIVHYDLWARRYVKNLVESGRLNGAVPV